MTMNRRWMLPLAVLLTACTPVQLSTFENVTGTDITPDNEAILIALPDAPMRLGDGRWVHADGTVTAVAGACSMWYPATMAAGFTPAQWPTVNAIMHRESRCQPSAYNRSGASGLMQIMPMWADDCGGTRAMLFDPQFNLNCARHILAVQGWQAWAL